MPKGHADSGGAGKVPVVGAIARKGMIVAKAIERAAAGTLQGFVRGNVHTVNLDSLLKHGIIGSFYHVSKVYLPLYLNEFSYRHNMCKNPNAFVELLTTDGR